MLRRWLKKHLVFQPDFVKNQDGSPGIWRLYLFFCESFSVRINVLWQDEPYSRHNHYWNGLSIILLGGYVETTYHDDGTVKKVMRRKPGSVRIQPAEEWHRTDYLTEGVTAVTLYFAGRRRREAEWRKDLVCADTDHLNQNWNVNTTKAA